jgi:ABC-type uncharacterized transport system auxiliary subunit
MRTTARIAPPARLAALVALLAVAAAMQGCYRRVVAARDTDTSNVEIHEANVERGESVWSAPEPKRIERDTVNRRPARPDSTDP